MALKYHRYNNTIERHTARTRTWNMFFTLVKQANLMNTILLRLNLYSVVLQKNFVIYKTNIQHNKKHNNKN